MIKRLLFAPLLLASCFAPHNTTVQTGTPHIVGYAQLPPYPASLRSDDNRIVVVFDVAPDGTVHDLRFLKASGSTAWDAEAADSLRLWRFAITPDVTEHVIIQDTIVIRIEEPYLVSVRELHLPVTDRLADSVYAVLSGGGDAGGIAGALSVRLTEARSVNASRYPPHIDAALRKLRVHEWTEPQRMDGSYVLFQRVE